MALTETSRGKFAVPARRYKAITVGRLALPVQALVLPALILVIWEFSGRVQFLPAGILPPPSTVVVSWWEWCFGSNPFGVSSYSGTWLLNVGVSALRVGEGYLLACVVGVPLGIMIGWSRLTERMIDPTVQALRPIPITAWLPFSIAVFGVRNFGAIFLIALGAFYPVAINAAHGARDVPRRLLRAAEMTGASHAQILFRVVLPWALPAIFTGLRLGVGIAWTAVVVAEMVAVKSGLGYVLWDAYYIGRMDIVIADMVSIGAVGFLSDRLILLTAQRLLRWKYHHNG